MDALNRAAESVHLPVKWDSGPGAPLSLPESLLEIAPASLTLSALKEAEDGEGLIIRIYNPTPETIQGEVTFGTAPDRILETNLEERNLHEISFQGSTLQSDWDPYSIRTFRVLSRLK